MIALPATEGHVCLRVATQVNVELAALLELEWTLRTFKLSFFRVLVQLMTSQVLSAFEASSAFWFAANERSVLAILVKLLQVSLQFLAGAEPNFAVLADEVACVDLDVDCVFAERLEHQLAIEASHLKVLKLDLMFALQVHAEILA